MPTIINRNLIDQVNQDSGSLTAATTVVHKFSEPGEYHGVLLYSHGTVIRQFEISVGGEEERAPTAYGEETKMGSLRRGKEERREEKEEEQEEEIGERHGRTHQRLPAKADIDLLDLHLPKAADGTAGDGSFKIRAGGYAVFRVPAGAGGGYAVEVYKAGEEGFGAKTFDSRELVENDMLAMVLLRPGTYSVTNVPNGAKAELKVAYPENIPRLMQPVKIRCTKDAILPNTIRVQPMQGLVFNFDTPSRVKIELVTPEDRPRRPALTRHAPVARQGGTTAGDTVSAEAVKIRKKVTRILQLHAGKS
jgi:hypothetical protein